MDRGALITTTDGGQYLLSQPCEIRLQMRKQRWRGENSRERLVTVEQVLGISFDHYVDAIEKSLQITLFDEGGPQIGHDEVTHKHHPLIRQVDEHRVMSLTALNRDQFHARAADPQVRVVVDRNAGLVAAQVVIIEALSEKLLTEDSGTIELPHYFFLVVAPAVEAGAWIQGVKIR